MPKTADTSIRTAQTMSDFPFAGFNFEAVVDGQRRNWAALMEANRVWAESAQTLATRQMEMARQAMQDLTELFEETLRKPGAFEDQFGKGAAYTCHTLEAICDLAGHASKSNAEVMKVFNKRMSETFEEVRSVAKRPPSAPGSAHAIAAG